MLILATFILAAAAAIVSAGAVLTQRNPVICALALVTNLLSTAVLFLTLGAQFIAVLQVIVYAGAIMVLIVFVIMLLSLPREPASMQATGGQYLLAGAGALVLLMALVRGIADFPPIPSEARAIGFGTAAWLAKSLFSSYFYPFEIISLVLLAAMAGAILLAKREV